MTTHQLARILLEMEDAPAMAYDDSGYSEISSILPATLYQRDVFCCVKFNVPVTREQRAKSFRALLIT